MTTDLYALISRDTPLRRTAATDGGEYSAPCPPMPRFPLMNQLSARQVAQFQPLAGIYRADLLDPAAWEALLLLLDICNILDLVPTVVEHILGAGIRERVETWSGEIHPRHAQSPAPAPIRRAWVWLPHESRPRLYPINGAGTIWLHDLDHPAPE